MILNRSTLAACGIALGFLLFGTASAQNYSFRYLYSYEPSMANEPPQVSGLDVDFPEAARKNGVEGTVKATMLLGNDGKVHDVVIVQDLPFGVGEAVATALKKLYFTPATTSGTPTAIRTNIDYIISITYDEGDKNVAKPQITEKPAAAYPASQLTEKIKGKVSVSILFQADGTLQVLGASSVMPRDFDKAALAAAAGIKFQPAVHKKSKKPVTQQMMVEYEFKP